MRNVMVFVACAALSLGATATQSGNKGACSVLTKDLVLAHSPASKQTLNVIMQIPPREDKVGGGTSCSHGDVNFMLDPYTVSKFEGMFGKYTPVAGVGDKAYFHDNKGRWAELAVVGHGHMITIQMTVPDGKTAAAIQPNTVALAKALLAKLK
jgi:hypothetical protein